MSIRTPGASSNGSSRGFQNFTANLFVIPGKLAIAGATRNPGWSNISACRIFTGMT
jgi:hypothetical protein